MAASRMGDAVAASTPTFRAAAPPTTRRTVSGSGGARGGGGCGQVRRERPIEERRSAAGRVQPWVPAGRRQPPQAQAARVAVRSPTSNAVRVEGVATRLCHERPRPQVAGGGGCGKETRRRHRHRRRRRRRAHLVGAAAAAASGGDGRGPPRPAGAAAIQTLSRVPSQSCRAGHLKPATSAAVGGDRRRHGRAAAAA